MSQLIVSSEGYPNFSQLVLQLRFKLTESVARAEQDRQTSFGGRWVGWSSSLLCHYYIYVEARSSRA
jgi:hypothetical protein